MKAKLSAFFAKDGAQKLLASLLSIVIGLAVGSVVVLIVGLANPAISLHGAWEGIRLIFAGILSTGRDAAGSLTGALPHQHGQYALPRHASYYDRPLRSGRL